MTTYKCVTGVKVSPLNAPPARPSGEGPARVAMELEQQTDIVTIVGEDGEKEVEGNGEEREWKGRSQQELNVTKTLTVMQFN